jgi:hypothetical protein
MKFEWSVLGYEIRFKIAQNQIDYLATHFLLLCLSTTHLVVYTEEDVKTHVVLISGIDRWRWVIQFDRLENNPPARIA